MKPTDTLKKPGVMANLRNSKGFSLVEMAIVLVIIGIIIAAIVKGQDLIINSQAKKVITVVSSWRNLIFAYQDRNGRLPGDEMKNGIINDETGEKLANQSAMAEITTYMTTAPENPMILGSSSFWIYIGSTTTTDSGDRNAIVVCGVVDCGTAFTVDQIEIIKSLDTAIDGYADGGAGQLRAVGVAAPVLSSVPSLVNNRRTSGFFGAATVGIVADVNTTASGTAAWTGGTGGNKAAIWLFERNF